MPDQALFAYRVALPDGSEAIRTGGADQAPTFGQLADYAANQGERFLGHVDMSPAPQPSAAPTPAAPERPSAVVPSAPPASSDPWAQWQAAVPDAIANPQSALPHRSLGSNALSMIGGAGGGWLGGMVPVAGPIVAPVTAGLGSAAGEAAQVGVENLMGWPAAEPGTLAGRTERAGVRGFVGEGAGQVLRGGAGLVSRAVGPTLRAAEEVAPALEQAVPAGVKGVPNAAGGFTPVADLLSSPGTLAATELTPKGQDTLTRVFWQQNAPKGAAAVVNAWDELGVPGQRAMAGGQHEAMSTLVDSLRPSVAPLMSAATGGQAIKAGVVPSVLTYAGHPHLAAAAGLTTMLGERYAPRMLLSPTMSPWLARLPAAADFLATPTSLLLRAGGQYGATQALP